MDNKVFGSFDSLGLRDFPAWAEQWAQRGVPSSAREFGDGFMSYFRGAYRFGRFSFRYCGCCGGDEQRAAALELRITMIVAEDVLSNEKARALAVDLAKNHFGDNPCRVVGRMTAGAGTSLLLTKQLGTAGRGVGALISVAAITGDALHHCESGLSMVRQAFPDGTVNPEEIAAFYEGLPGEARQQLIGVLVETLITGERKP